MSQFNSLQWGQGTWQPIGMGPPDVIPVGYGDIGRNASPSDSLYGAHGMNVADPAFGPYGPGGQMTGAYANPVQGLAPNTSVGQGNQGQAWATWQMTGVYRGPDLAGPELGAAATGVPAGLYAHDGYVYGWMPQKAIITIRYSPKSGKGVIQVTPGSTAYSAILNVIVKIGKPNISDAQLNALPAPKSTAISTSGSAQAQAQAASTANARSFLSSLIGAATQVASVRQAQAAATTAPVAQVPPMAVEPVSEGSPATPWLIGGAAALVGVVALAAFASKGKDKK